MGLSPTVLGYFGVSRHWACQECSTKKECLSSLLFSMIVQCSPIELWFLQDLFTWKDALLCSERCSPHEKIGVPNSKDIQNLLMLTEVCNADWGVLITHTAVTVLWHPWVG